MRVPESRSAGEWERPTPEPAPQDEPVVPVTFCSVHVGQPRATEGWGPKRELGKELWERLQAESDAQVSRDNFVRFVTGDRELMGSCWDERSVVDAETLHRVGGEMATSSAEYKRLFPMSRE